MDSAISILAVFLSIAGFNAPSGVDEIQLGTTDCAHALSALLAQGAVTRIESTQLVSRDGVLYTLVGDARKTIIDAGKKPKAPVALLMCGPQRSDPETQK